MKIAIVYATKSQASSVSAYLLKEYLLQAEIFNIQETQPEITFYDVIIIGAGVRDGNMYKPIRDFMKKQKDLLLSKDLAFYICHEKAKKFQEIVDKNISPDFQQKALNIMSFGGYKANAIPDEEKNDNMQKGLMLENIQTFSNSFK